MQSNKNYMELRVNLVDWAAYTIHKKVIVWISIQYL